MGIIKVVGTLTNICSNVAFDNVVKPLVKETGNKVVDKVVIPWGITVTGWMVGAAAQNYIEGELNEVKAAFDKINDIRKEFNKFSEEDDFEDDIDVDNIVENVFDKSNPKEESDNGE